MQNLSVAFGETQVTFNVSFDIFEGEIFALMGESGSGKSVTAMAIPRLLPYPSANIVSGKIIFEGKNLLETQDIKSIRGKMIGCVFQEPMQALNPVMSIGAQLLETAPKNRIEELLVKAGFKDTKRIFKSYPHEMSGGMLQRIVICMALAQRPSLIIADEPTTSIDANLQTTVMDTLKNLCKEENAAVLFITHNVRLAETYANRTAIMYRGKILDDMEHPYIKELFGAFDGLKRIESLPSD